MNESVKKKKVLRNRRRSGRRRKEGRTVTEGEADKRQLIGMLGSTVRFSTVQEAPQIRKNGRRVGTFSGSW